MCPRTRTYVSSYRRVWLRAAYSYMCPRTSICVLILVHMCPRTSIYVSSYSFMCPHTGGPGADSTFQSASADNGEARGGGEPGRRTQMCM
jgi:hypothetical protein